MIAVTTVGKAAEEIAAHAKARAAALGLPYCERESNLSEMLTEETDGFLVYGKKPPFLWTEAGEHAFHLGTAELRLLQLSRGGSDRLCSLLPEGTRTVLDCTFGEGKDSVVFSQYLGDAGEVTALEKSAALWEVGHEGLLHFKTTDAELAEALSRIRLLRADFREFLKSAAPESFDVIYFDTMFRAPVAAGVNNRDAFRAGACYDSLDEETLLAACRAAKMRVIVKERPFSKIFRTGLFDTLQHHKGQSTAYGIIDKRA